MLEAVELGNRIDKESYAREMPALRASLIDTQRLLADSNLAAAIVLGGSEGAGKERTIGLLLEWLDARGIHTHAMWDVTDEERARPEFWRFWRALPPRGRMAIFFGSWYTEPIIDRVYGRSDDVGLERQMRRIRQFERMLTNENVVLVKLWMHLSKDAQNRSIKKLKADPRTRWRVRGRASKFLKRYDDFRNVSEMCLRLTNTDFAPWHLVEATDRRYRNLTVANTLLRTLREALAEHDGRDVTPPNVASPEPSSINVVRSLDLTRQMPRDEFDRRLARYQGKLSKLAFKLRKAGKSVILVFEGPDAAGKGGAIRRITGAIDPRLWRVMSVAAPTDEEAAHPYLWRFWRDLPKRGHITIYDRSWYGRVLVERVEGFCAPKDWRRAYAEINQFEEQLDEFGIVVVKFWLAIGPDEQLRRFQDRKQMPYKQYKLTEEDWRNREKWDAYEAAACDMIERTSTDNARWVLVEANDKYFARIKVLDTVCQAIRKSLADAANREDD